MKKGIYWLASYPKSGNTWFRILLTTLLQGTNKPLNLDNLDGSMASSRAWINNALGFDSTYLCDDELDQLRPAIYSWYAEQDTKVNYHKIHDAYTYVDTAKPLIPASGCLGAIYIIRNPLDVAISFAYHSNISIDMMIELMGNFSLAVPVDIHRHKQLRQKLLSWSHHVTSWKSASAINVLFLRYEDMLLAPFETFKKGMAFLNIDVSDAALQQAIDRTLFHKLQQQEAENGFKEKTRVAKRFFRKGIAGDWENTLTTAQIDKLIRDHGEVMYQYGYLDQHYHPIRVCS